MPRHTYSKTVGTRTPNPNNRDWERKMMKQLNHDKLNPNEVLIEPPFGYEFGSYGEFVDQFYE